MAAGPPSRVTQVAFGSLAEPLRRQSARHDGGGTPRQNVLPSRGSLLEALARRARKNWRKRTAFIVLIVAGLILWIPPLLRATVGEGVDVGSLSAETRDLSSRASNEESADGPKATSTRLSYPTVDKPSLTGADRIVLTATILGKTRRAAIINGRLYREGDHIVAAGEPLRLTSVGENRVELSSETSGHGSADRHLSLSLTSPQSSARLAK